MRTTYYRGSDIIITAEWILLPGVATYRLRNLSEIHRVAVRTGWRRWSYELRAIYVGQSIVLYRTTDEKTHGRVTRALVRALESEAAESVAEKWTPGLNARGGTLIAAGGAAEPPRDPWLDPAADEPVTHERPAGTEARWRTVLERLLALPLTVAGAETVAADRFDKRLTDLLATLGEPDAGRSA